MDIVENHWPGDTPLNMEWVFPKRDQLSLDSKLGEANSLHLKH